MQNLVFRAIVCAIAIASANDAAAQIFGQAWTDRGYVNFNGGFESVSGNLNDSATRTIYGEQASLSVAHAVDSGSFFDFSAGARVWRNVSVGIGFHEGKTTGEASMTGNVPHPLIFNRPRPISIAATDLERSERAVHLQFGYMLPINDRISVHVMLGPSFFKLRQDVVSDVTLNETPPFNTAGGAGVTAERVDSPTGFNIGADVTFNAYTKDQFKVGAGMFVRFTGASANVQLLQNVVDSDVGGLQVGFGVRARF